VESGDEEEDDLKGVAADSDPDTEVEQASEDDELALLLRDNARLKAEEAALTAQRVAQLRRDNERRTARIAALQRADADVGPAPTSPAASAAAGVQTPAPAPASLRPRALFSSALGRGTPSAAAVARQAALEQLPSLAAASDTGPIVIAPVSVAGGSGPGRVSVPVITTVVPAGAAPAVPSSASAFDKPRTSVKQPEAFTGDDTAQNEKVELWVDAVNRYLRLGQVPAHLHLDTARSCFSSTGGAGEFVKMREEEAAAIGKQLTWEYLQAELISHYAQRVGQAALEAEWAVLRMGVKPGADVKDTSKSTWTVKSYTTRFLYLLRRLTTQTPQSTDLTTVQKYVGGIRDGYPALYAMMLGLKPTLRFISLQDAIDEAEVAEANIAIVKMDSRSSSSPPAWAAAKRYGGGGHRAATESLNNLQGEYSNEGEGSVTAPSERSPGTQVYGFRYNPGPTDGRYKLSEKEQRMLYDEKRCYRCYGQHPVGRGQPPCTKPVMKVAPKPLN
jgi:hypothetical protein